MSESAGLELRRRMGHEPGFGVADDVYTRRVYGKDLWPRNLIVARETALPDEVAVDAVAWPASVDQVAKFLKLAAEKNWEVYPHGAGSGVCGGATVSAGDRARQKIVLDLKRMDRIEGLDGVSLTAAVQAGILGQVLEESLNAKGYTMGHFPSSIYCSTFGGYLATRAAGQLSTYYGKMEDIVLSVEGVLPGGEVFRTPLAPRLATGPDWNQVFVGSEGTLGVLTSAVVKIHPLPQERKFAGYQVGSTEKALDGVRRWLQAGLRPAAVRIYDEDESRMLMGYKRGVKLVAVVEGDAALTGFQFEHMRRMAAGFDGFEERGPEPAEEWWARRYDVSYRQQQILSHRRMILDTFEVSTTWSRLPALHKAIKRVSADFSDEGMLVILSHFSHFYHSGGNIYFTLCGRSPDEAGAAAFYDKVWDALLAACLREGAAISHHHGIGRLKSKALAKSHGPLHGVFRKLKNELDPQHLLNPQNLGL